MATTPNTALAYSITSKFQTYVAIYRVAQKNGNFWKTQQ